MVMSEVLMASAAPVSHALLLQTASVHRHSQPGFTIHACGPSQPRRKDRTSVPLAERVWRSYFLLCYRGQQVVPLGQRALCL